MTDFDSCFAMRKGKLVLRGIASNQTLPNDTAPYLTGGVYTKGQEAFLDGRIEICAKLNAAKGDVAGSARCYRKCPMAVGRRNRCDGASE